VRVRTPIAFIDARIRDYLSEMDMSAAKIAQRFTMSQQAFTPPCGSPGNLPFG
jgi:hypothetical protein